MNEADDRGRTLLYVASRKGKTQFVNKALKLSSGDTVDMCNQSGKSALYAAAVSGDEEIVEILIKAGARVNLRDLNGRTALWAAMYHGCAGTVQRLINLGADPNQSDYDGTTPLIAAAAGESKMGPKHNRLCVTKLLTFADDDEVMVNAKITRGAPLCGRQRRVETLVFYLSCYQSTARMSTRRTSLAGRRCKRRVWADTASACWL